MRFWVKQLIISFFFNLFYTYRYTSEFIEVNMITKNYCGFDGFPSVLFVKFLTN